MHFEHFKLTPAFGFSVAFLGGAVESELVREIVGLAGNWGVDRAEAVLACDLASWPPVADVVFVLPDCDEIPAIVLAEAEARDTVWVRWAGSSAKLPEGALTVDKPEHNLLVTRCILRATDPSGIMSDVKLNDVDKALRSGRRRIVTGVELTSSAAEMPELIAQFLRGAKVPVTAIVALMHTAEGKADWGCGLYNQPIPEIVCQLFPVRQLEPRRVELAVVM